MLSSPSGSSTFTSDEDPQLIADSMPLALKIYELILSGDPGNSELAAATGRNFIMYSGAFVHISADMRPNEEWQAEISDLARAKKLYRRGRDYLLDSLEWKYSGFKDLLFEGAEGDHDTAISLLEEEDADTAYWIGLAWLGMASTAPFDLELGATLDRAVLLLYRSMELMHDNSQLHDLMIQVQLSLPSSIVLNLKNKSPHITAYIDNYYSEHGVSNVPRERAVYHYERALEFSEGLLPTPHITIASALAVREQDVEAFRRYLELALEINADDNLGSRLLVLIYQRKAQWLLENIEDYFLEV